MDKDTIKKRLLTILREKFNPHFSAFKNKKTEIQFTTERISSDGELLFYNELNEIAFS